MRKFYQLPALSSMKLDHSLHRWGFNQPQFKHMGVQC